MLSLDRLWQDRHRKPVLMISGAIILGRAAVDWWTKPDLALDVLYLFPIMFAWACLPRWFVALLGVVCVVLAEVFIPMRSSVVRFSFDDQSLARSGWSV